MRLFKYAELDGTKRYSVVYELKPNEFFSYNSVAQFFCVDCYFLIIMPAYEFINGKTQLQMGWLS